VGLLSQYIENQYRKKAAQEVSQAEGYKAVLNIPGGSPEVIAAKTQAIQGLLKVSKMKGPEKDAFSKLLAISAYAPQKQGGSTGDFAGETGAPPQSADPGAMARYKAPENAKGGGLFQTDEQAEAAEQRSAQLKADMQFQEAQRKAQMEAQMKIVERQLNEQEDQRRIKEVTEDPNMTEEQKQLSLIDITKKPVWELGYVQPPLGKPRQVWVNSLSPGTVKSLDGKPLTVPEGWNLHQGDIPKATTAEEKQGKANQRYQEAHGRAAESATDQAQALREYDAAVEQPKETKPPEDSIEVRDLTAFYKSQGKSDADARNQALKDVKDKYDIEQAKRRAEARKAGQADSMPTVDPGTAEYNVANMLGSGKLTMQEFRSLYAYSRDASKRVAIFNTARELHPDFDPAAFELGFRLAGTSRVQQQVSSLNNVESGVHDLLKASEEAARSGSPLLNKAIIPTGGIVLGKQKYSNWNTARIAFADELSGALGFGSATDMSREMGFNMTDATLSPEAFRSAIKDIVIPFVDRKKASLLQGMGVYGQPGMSPAAGPAQFQIKIGDKTYNYKGTGATDDLSNYTEVPK
jgi:hypothetical protein